jgi:hypothetical protein
MVSGEVVPTWVWPSPTDVFEVLASSMDTLF